MSYVNYDELIARYPLVKKWDDRKSIVNSDVIHYASRQLDALLGTHFTVPFTPAHPTVKDLTLDLCKYRVLLDQDQEKAAALYSIVKDQIDMLKAGEMSIVTDSGDELAQSAVSRGVWSNTKDYHPTHTMLGDESAYTIVDSSMLSDLENERS
jgi:phage gp36-like protein